MGLRKLNDMISSYAAETRILCNKIHWKNSELERGEKGKKGKIEDFYQFKFFGWCPTKFLNESVIVVMAIVMVIILTVHNKKYWALLLDGCCSDLMHSGLTGFFSCAVLFNAHITLHYSIKSYSKYLLSRHVLQLGTRRILQTFTPPPFIYSLHLSYSYIYFSGYTN